MRTSHCRNSSDTLHDESAVVFAGSRHLYVGGASEGCSSRKRPLEAFRLSAKIQH